MGEAVIRLENVSYCYPRTKKWVLNDISLEINEGDFVAVMGENGAGKTTFCQCLNGIIPHSKEGRLKGRVTVLGMDTANTEIARLSENIGMVLEDPDMQIFTTVIRNEVAFGPENLRVDPDEIRKRVVWSLDVVGLSEYIDSAPTALSGGQKQRLAIASALAMQPKILILDEPTSQLDPIGTQEVFKVIREIRNKYKMTIVIATHKSEEIAEFADKVLVIKSGRIVRYDEPKNVFKDIPLMRDNWIRPPQVSELAVYLQEQGDPLSEFPVLIKDAEEALTTWFRAGRAL